MNEFIVDGIQYYYRYTHNIGILEVFNNNRFRIADAVLCDKTECFYYDYYNDIEGNLEQGGASSDLYFNHKDNPLELSIWLTSTHPEN